MPVPFGLARVGYVMCARATLVAGLPRRPSPRQHWKHVGRLQDQSGTGLAPVFVPLSHSVLAAPVNRPSTDKKRPCFLGRAWSLGGAPRPGGEAAAPIAMSHCAVKQALMATNPS